MVLSLCCGAGAVYSQKGFSVNSRRGVVGQTLCSPGNDLLNRNSLGHLLMADAVLWDGRCVLKGSTCLIDILRGISSWQ